MKNERHWHPTKYQNANGEASVGSVGPGSRLAADLVARAYGTHVPRFATGTLADLGCGEVPLYDIYRTHVDRIVCVDWPSSKHTLSHVDVECDLSQPLPFLPGSFQTVVLSDVLEHVPEPAALWSELGRIVAPGGYVLVNVPFLYWLHEEPHDYYRYTSYALRRLAEGSGFRVEHLEALGGSIEVGVDFISKHLSVVPVIGRWLARIVQAVGISWSRSAPGASLIRLTGKRFPLSYFMVVCKDG
jgi:SAM-dependent methyltransferase